MEYLHANGVVHAHLKTTNILVDQDMSVKIADIGLRRVKSCLEVISLQRSFTLFTAPEVFRGQVATFAADVYAFGWILWEIIAREVPHQDKSLQYIRSTLVNKGHRLPIPKIQGYPSGVGACVQAAWGQERKGRPEFAELR